MNDLVKTRKQRLRELENEIRTNFEGWVKTGFALKEIKDDELFKEAGYKNWTEYQKKRLTLEFGIEGDWAQRVIKASVVRAKIESSPTPGSDSEKTGWNVKAALELARLAPMKKNEKGQSRDVESLSKVDVNRVAKASMEEAKKQNKPLTSTIVRKFVDKDLGIDRAAQAAETRRKRAELPPIEQKLRDYIGSIEGIKAVLTRVPGDAWQYVEKADPGIIKRLADACNELLQLMRSKPNSTPKPRPVNNNKFNEVNENIDWAKWSWNPVTGCEHGCQYCYARDIANRFYKNKFKPTFHEYRLKAPYNTTIPKELSKHPGRNKVFVCSMADLFGEWVNQEWIDKILSVCADTPKWDYIFLTKNPKRLTTINWPDNAWVGTTVDIQKRVGEAEKAFEKVDAKVKFLSCEPLSEELVFNNIGVFDWVIIGARSKSTLMPAMMPNFKWILSILKQAWEKNCDVYCKPNLEILKQYPNI